MGPTRYEIVVAGELSRRFASAFDGMTMQCRCGKTAITGMVIDQAHLYGLLNRVGELGLDLVSVVPVGDDSPGLEQGRGGSAAGAWTG